MKQIFYISLLMLAVVAVGCKTTKKSVQSTVTATDTSRTQQGKEVNNSNDTNTYREVRDTAVGVKGKSLRDTADITTNDIPRKKSGKAMPQYQEKKQDGVRIWVMVDTTGRLMYGADVDSITLIIKGLERENTMIRSSRDSMAYLLAYKATAKQSDTVITKVITATWWGRNWRWIVGVTVGIIALIIVWYISRFTKGFGS